MGKGRDVVPGRLIDFLALVCNSVVKNLGFSVEKGPGPANLLKIASLTFNFLDGFVGITSNLMIVSENMLCLGDFNLH